LTCEVLWIFLFCSLILFIFIVPRTLICIVPTSSPMLRRLLIPEQRGSGVKVGTGCLDERELEYSLWSIFLWRVISILKWYVVRSRRLTQKMMLVERVDIQRDLQSFRCGSSQCTDRIG
jgi:hypothetical protein